MFSKKKLSSKEIMKAAKKGEEADIRKQLQKLSPEDAKALIDTPDENGEKALHIAAESGHLKFVNLLIEYGANPNVIGIFNETPLHRAAAKNHGEIAKSLLKAGANPNLARTDSEKPIHVASDYDAIDVIKALIEHDPSQVNWTSKERRTPFFYVDTIEINNILINAGATEENKKMDYSK